uniref:Uncharacterized protein n=1 Tax=Aegilops tauschii TaxID=37682 RepID=M8C203_AEGTA
MSNDVAILDTEKWGEHFKGIMDWRCKNAHTENSNATKLGGLHQVTKQGG